MIFVGTRLLVVDNSGALIAKCIRLYKNTTKAVNGDVVLVSLKKVKPNRKVKKGQVFKAVVVQSRGWVRSVGGQFICSDTNCIVLLKDNYDIFGTRFKGPIFHKLLDYSNLKPLILSSHVY